MSKCRFCINTECENFSDEDKDCKDFKLVSRADLTVYKRRNSLWNEFYKCEKCGWYERFIPSHNRCVGCGKRIILKEREYTQYES